MAGNATEHTLTLTLPEDQWESATRGARTLQQAEVIRRFDTDEPSRSINLIVEGDPITDQDIERIGDLDVNAPPGQEDMPAGVRFVNIDDVSPAGRGFVAVFKLLLRSGYLHSYGMDEQSLRMYARSVEQDGR